MSDEALIADEAMEMYKELVKYYQEHSTDALKILVQGLYKIAKGKVHIIECSPAYIQADGIIENTCGESDYSLTNIVSTRYKESETYRLIEDLTMGYYKVRGGKYFFKTNQLMQYIKENGGM